jgi:hypothetical protein
MYMDEMYVTHRAILCNGCQHQERHRVCADSLNVSLSFQFHTWTPGPYEESEPSSSHPFGTWNKRFRMGLWPYRPAQQWGCRQPRKETWQSSTSHPNSTLFNTFWWDEWTHTQDNNLQGCEASRWGETALLQLHQKGRIDKVFVLDTLVWHGHSLLDDLVPLCTHCDLPLTVSGFAQGISTSLSTYLYILPSTLCSTFLEMIAVPCLT